MNVRLEKDFNFMACAYLDDSVICNKYKIKMELFTNTMDGVEQNVALDRVRHMLYNRFSNRLFISNTNQDIADQFHAMGLKTVVLPEVPVDQIIGIMLFTKLNAVMENRLIVTQLKICSELGDHMWYCQDSEEDFGPFENDGWWHESTDNVNTVDVVRPGKVVNFRKSKKGWADHNLDWDHNDDSTEIEFSND